jgi:hypothetical protein
VVWLARDLRHTAHPAASLAAAHSVIRNARGRKVLDLSKTTVLVLGYCDL